MERSILTVKIRYEQDVVLARQRARQVAALLGFDGQDQVRIATAVSEIARNAFQYAGGGKVEYAVAESGRRRFFRIRATDDGPGIPHLDAVLDGRYTSRTGMGLGLVGARRLMDGFRVESRAGGGTTVVLDKEPPARATDWSAAVLAGVAKALSRSEPQTAFEEMQRQNQELVAALEQLERLNRELEDTNRGVVALYAELDEHADYLRRASEIKSRFLSNMTHEFRTPLNSILSLSRMLLDRLDGDLTAEQARQVGFIQRSASALAELVDDLLDLAKVEAGKLTVRPHSFQAAELFGALRGMLKPLLAQNASVSLVIDDPQGIPPLHTDESKLSQILRNFISNALKYTERGEIRVTAATTDDGRVTFAVADTGPGIAPQHQAVIFEEFEQVEGAHQHGKKGTGLGLPLSRKLAELLGGTVGVRSRPGVGSTFFVTIPAEYAGPADAPFVHPTTPELDPMRLPVLVVDDNPETLFVYDRYLKGTGFQCVGARTVRDARDVLARVRPVAVVLDILLESENAWDFLAELKGSSATRDVPVWVVTMVDNERKARALGADDFHAKPVERQWLVDRLTAAVDGARRSEVLVIDDDEVSRYVVTGALADTRFRVVEARDGTEGMRLAVAHPPAAIVLDLAMPDVSGFEVLDRLKSTPATRGIPVVVHSGRELSVAERERIAPHVVAIVPKAASEQGLLDALRRAGCGGNAAGDRDPGAGRVGA